MNRKLEDYIDDYISQPGTSPGDRETARHLKAIIPSSTHIEKDMLDFVIDEIEVEIQGGKNFKDSFIEVAARWILEGDEITAPLPDKLTRIIVNYRRFLEYLSNKEGIPVNRIKKRIASKGILRFLKSIGHLKLAPQDVVLATFDEANPDRDPFIHNRVAEIVHMLALNLDLFKSGESMTAIKIRYDNPLTEKLYPTFCDVGWYDKFYPSSAADPYGRTKSADPNLRDMPEIAHENLELSKMPIDVEVLKD